MLMDTNNDGKVTYEELKAGLRKVGSQLAEPEIKLLMDVVNVIVFKITLELFPTLYLFMFFTFSLNCVA